MISVVYWPAILNYYNLLYVFFVLALAMILLLLPLQHHKLAEFLCVLVFQMFMIANK